MLVVVSLFFAVAPIVKDAVSIIWQKYLGRSKDDVAFSVSVTPDGGYIVVGYTESNDGDVSGNHGGADVWVVKPGW